MGLFGTIGAVGGGIIGGIYGGGPEGAAAGAAVGGALGGSLDPKNDINGQDPNVMAQQAALVAQLQQQAAGTTPSLAQLQLQKNNDMAIRQNAGFVASQKGINPGLAARLAAQNEAVMSQQGVQNSAILGAQQQIQAQQQLAGVLGGERSAGLQNQGQLLQNQQTNNARSTSMFGGLLNGAGGAINYGILGNQNTNQVPQNTMNNPNLMNTGNLNYNTSGTSNSDTGAYQGSGENFGGVAGLGSNVLGNYSSNQNFSKGGKVPGKDPVPDKNTKENDVIDAKVSPGEIIIPVTSAKDPVKAKAFIDKLFGAKKVDHDEVDIANIMKINSQLKKKASK